MYNYNITDYATRLCAGFMVHSINFFVELKKVHHVRSSQGWRKRDIRYHNFFERLQLQDAIRAEIKDQNPKDTHSDEKAFHPDRRQKINALLLEEDAALRKPGVATFFADM